MSKPKARKTELSQHDIELIDEVLELIEKLTEIYGPTGTNQAVWNAVNQLLVWIEENYEFAITQGIGQIRSYAGKLFGGAESDGHEPMWASWIHQGINRVKADTSRFRTAR